MALFKVGNDGLESLSLHSFRDRDVGGQGEQTLQDFIADFPDLVPGEEIDVDDPSVFVVIKAEAGVSSGSLDILLVDQKAVPTVIEAKLIDNRENSTFCCRARHRIYGASSGRMVIAEIS